jgi:hypothetical protein
MVTAYALQAAACFIVPTVWGASVPSLLVLIFLIASLGQIITPAVKAATALVTTMSHVAGVVLTVGAVRAWWVPSEGQSASLRHSVRKVDWPASIPTLRRTAEWVFANQ